jgi:hypothetical protein
LVQCDKLYREVMIGEVVCISHQDKVAKEGQHDYFELSLVCETQLYVAAPSSAENIKWVLSIDGMKDRSILTTAIKVPNTPLTHAHAPHAQLLTCVCAGQLSLLRARHFVGVRGGSIKSSDDEEWIYNGKTGELSILGGLRWAGRKLEVAYAWNGQTLVPTRVAVDGDDTEEAQRTRESGFGSGTPHTHDTARIAHAHAGRRLMTWACEQACGMA